jgi:hypothetical protein
MYKDNSPQNIKKIRQFINDKADKNSRKVNLKSALTDKKYKRATWTNFGYMIFHELAGNNVV